MQSLESAAGEFFWNVGDKFSHFLLQATLYLPLLLNRVIGVNEGYTASVSPDGVSIFEDNIDNATTNNAPSGALVSVFEEAAGQQCAFLTDNEAFSSEVQEVEKPMNRTCGVNRID